MVFLFVPITELHVFQEDFWEEDEIGGLAQIYTINPFIKKPPALSEG